MVLDAQSAPNITGPAGVDGIGPTDDWQGYWQRTDRKRQAASWDERLLTRIFGERSSLSLP